MLSFPAVTPQRSLAAGLEKHEAAQVETRTAFARATEHVALLESRVAERTGERDGARAEVAAMHTRLKALAAARDLLEAERAALVRESDMTALLERLVADDRTGRVLTLLESIEARRVCWKLVY